MKNDGTIVIEMADYRAIHNAFSCENIEDVFYLLAIQLICMTLLFQRRRPHALSISL